MVVTVAGCFQADRSRPDTTDNEGDNAARGSSPGAGGPSSVPGSAGPAPPASDYDFASAIVVDHPHFVPEEHSAQHYVEQLDWYDLTPGAVYGAMMTGQYMDVEACGEMLAVGSYAGNRGFTLVNVTDPANVSNLAQFANNGFTRDVAFTPDCKFVILAMSEGVLPADAPYTRAQHGGLQDTGRSGLMVVNVSNVVRPVVESFLPGGSAARVFAFEGTDASYVVTDAGMLFRLALDASARWALEEVAEVPTWGDVHVARHPVSGLTYLFTGTDGLTIVDVSIPGTPRAVASLGRDDGVGPTTEQTPAGGLIGGRWLVFSATESQAGHPSQVSVVDVTTPGAPVRLGSWVLPGDFTAHAGETGYYTFSPHGIAVRDDGRVAVSHGHAGIWVFDASTPARHAAPVTLGFAQPYNVWQVGGSVQGEEVPVPATDVPTVQSPTVMKGLPFTPFVWGAAWTYDGTLAVSDLNSGLYTYRVD